jgi:N,N'-diacetyllegionaminate synthase
MSLIIAEAGINYNSFEEAKKLIEMAAFAGARAVKFQIFWGLGRLEKYELTKNQWKELHDLCAEYVVAFMATPHCDWNGLNKDTIDFVDSLVKVHKIASPYLTNRKYVEYIASKGKPILMSTGSMTRNDGMATMAQIKKTLSWIPKANVTLLHCVSQYPPKNPHYERILKLKKLGRPVGLSDHSLNKMVHCWPIIEKHFKLSDNCIDSKVSLNPEEFREMVRNIYNFESIFGKL